MKEFPVNPEEFKKYFRKKKKKKKIEILFERLKERQIKKKKKNPKYFLLGLRFKQPISSKNTFTTRNTLG